MEPFLKQNVKETGGGGEIRNKKRIIFHQEGKIIKNQDT